MVRQYVCVCEELGCSQSTYPDQATGQLAQGHSFSYSAYRRHVAELRSMRLSLLEAATLKAALQTEVAPAAATESSEETALVDQMASLAIDEDTHNIILHGVLGEFDNLRERARPYSDMATLGALVFKKDTYSHPPASLLPTSDDLVLKGDDHKNRPFLKHVNELEQLLERIDKEVSAVTTPRLRELRKSLVQRLQAELSAMDKAKEMEWKRRASSHRASSPEVMADCKLDEIERQTDELLGLQSEFSALAFKFPPTSSPRKDDSSYSPTRRDLKLNKGDVANATLLARRTGVDNLKQQSARLDLHSWSNLLERQVDLDRKFDEELQRLELAVVEDWIRQAAPKEERSFYDHWLLHTPPVVVAVMVITFAQCLFAGLTVKGCRFGLHGSRLIIKLAMLACGADPTADGIQDILDGIPLTLATLRKRLRLEPTITTYACCSKCWACYPLTPTEVSDKSSRGNGTKTVELYPLYCQRKPTKTSPRCNTRLVRKEIVSPNDTSHGLGSDLIQEFVYHDVKVWLGKLLSRPGMEKVMDETPQKCFARDATGDRLDVWDGKVLRTFLGRDKKHFFTPSSSEGRYCFSLFVDWFKAHTKKPGGKAASLGCIYLACLNLPPDLRYLKENMCLVGVIPGPKEPSLSQINHLLKPLVDDFLILWKRGVFYTRTAGHDTGRTVRAVIVPLVCDLPAIRQVAGLAGFGFKKRFCSFCTIPFSNVRDLNVASWPPTTWADHRKFANLWKASESTKEQEKVFKDHGIRWSELYRLPYWDPTRFVVLEPMHNLLLGLLDHHCSEIWGMNDEVSCGDGSPEEHRAYDEAKKELLRSRLASRSPEDAAEIDSDEHAARIFRGLSEGNKNKPGRVNRAVLQQFCERRDIDTELTNAELWAALKAWFSTKYGLVPDREKTVRKAVLGKEMLEELWGVIDSTSLPSWVGRVPKRIGSPGAGNPTADEWRTVCTIHLPIALWKCWGQESAGSRRRAMMDNYMHLVAAIRLATTRSTSEAAILSYEKHIKDYLQGLEQLYPHRPLRANHHLALHLGQCLRNFGPVHAWWAFPFERMIGVLQRVNNNNRLRDIGRTMTMATAMGANLRALLSSRTAELNELKDLFNLVFKRGENRGTLATDMLHLAPSDDSAPDDSDDAEEDLTKNQRLITLSDETRKALSELLQAHGDIAGSAVAVNQLKLKGNSFASANCSIDNSRVQYWKGRELRYGQIREIFTHKRFTEKSDVSTETFLCVQRYQEPTAGEGNVFQKFDIGARILNSEFHPHVDIIRPVDIQSHIATCECAPSRLAVLTLDRS